MPPQHTPPLQKKKSYVTIQHKQNQSPKTIKHATPDQHCHDYEHFPHALRWRALARNSLTSSSSKQASSKQIGDTHTQKKQWNRHSPFPPTKKAIQSTNEPLSLPAHSLSCSVFWYAPLCCLPARSRCFRDLLQLPLSTEFLNKKEKKNFLSIVAINVRACA